MAMKAKAVAACAAVVLGVGGYSGTAAAQSLQERIQAVRDQNLGQGRQVQQQQRAAQAGVNVQTAMRTNLGEVNLEGMTAREAFAWIGQQANLPLLINWQRLSLEEGVDPEQVVQLRGSRMSAELALNMLAGQVAFDEPLIVEPTPWYVEVMSKNQANQRTVVRVYPVGDLVTQAPQFTNAPAFDLQQITQSGGGGGGSGTGGLGGGGGGGGLFGGGQGGGGGGGRGGPGGGQVGVPRDVMISDLARLIMDTIEPNIWQQNGGLYGSITQFGDNLVVRAPLYVHRQIGRPQPTVMNPVSQPSAAAPGGTVAERAAGAAQRNATTTRPGISAGGPMKTSSIGLE